jgi:hypothetical protein
MGKGKKRANSGVGVDFRKVKHKVGKKLPKAQNETRTDFQARSINLPNQSITQDKTGAAVSERNLTLKVSAVWFLCASFDGSGRQGASPPGRHCYHKACCRAAAAQTAAADLRSVASTTNHPNIASART